MKKKILDSDWLRGVQFKCKTRTKSVAPVQKVRQHQCKLLIVILDYDFLRDNRKFPKPIISSETMTNSLYGKFEKSFLECKNLASRKIFRHFLHANFFMFILLISNLTVFSRSIGNCFSKNRKIALAGPARAIPAF